MATHSNILSQTMGNPGQWHGPLPVLKSISKWVEYFLGSGQMSMTLPTSLTLKTENVTKRKVFFYMDTKTDDSAMAGQTINWAYSWFR